ncbi:hypothetical protein BJX68DRAFT_196030 [Aspergillus pseudodeflectus]|uniref:Uncharacterized protein n=1 Tax=Aspergillus pseudodeflectus TaxID=176178 RepID=A0ABR4JJL3_9EURO
MPALIEPGTDNRRPRRSSITQQFQRMFNFDKTNDSRRSVSYDDSSKGKFATSTLPSNIQPAVENNDPQDYAKYRHSGISTNEQSHISHSSLGSKITGLNTSVSRPSSLQSFGVDAQQPAKNSLDGPLHRQDTASHVVQKKDRRATKRLEAERLELEKRLFKLEEAERTGDVSALRRESRRLTKKQPLGSSSRSSSVSADESRSRPSSRLSSLFSGSRRRSRSRSSSIDAADNRFGSKDAPSSDSPNALPKLPSTLPERLSTAISKELAARKNALLTPPEQSTPSLQSEQATSECTHGIPKQLITQKQDDTVTHLAEPSSSHAAQKDEYVRPETATNKARQQADLDRALFTASLNSGKKTASSEHPLKTAISTKSSTTLAGASLTDLHSAADIDQIDTYSRPRSAVNSRAGLPVSMLARVTTDGIALRHQKTFKSSPLAESQTVNGDDVPAPQKGATTLASQKNPPNVLRTSSGNIPDKMTTSQSPKPFAKPSATESKIPRSSFSRKPASKLSLPSGRSNMSVTLPPMAQQRDPSPSVPPKSPKRNSRSISQSPESLRGVSDSRLRPPSSLSAGQSYDSESDYNTADEAASIVSRMSDDHNSTASKMRSIPKKGVPSGFDSASTAIVSSNLKAESKKQVKRTKQAGRDHLVAKLFVICCRCKFWHDMPSEVYASLANSDPLSAALDEELAAWERNSLSDRLTTSVAGTRSLRESSTKPAPKADIQQRSVRTRVTTDVPLGPVKCCWCEHHMSKQCCQGWTTVVQMRQRHH